VTSSGIVASQVVDLRTDFEKHFHPFVVKKNVQLAPRNWFLERKKRTVILDSEEDAKMYDDLEMQSMTLLILIITH
jgi:hypothetical protein